MSDTTLDAQRTRRGAARMLLAAAAVVVVLSGCLPAPSASGTVTATSASGGAAVAGVSASAERDAYDLRLAACLRTAGFDVPDPQPGEGIAQTGAAVRAAASTCMQTLGDPPLQQKWTDAGNQEAHERALKTARCLRERGYDIDDPQPETAMAVPEGVTQADFAACDAADLTPAP